MKPVEHIPWDPDYSQRSMLLQQFETVVHPKKSSSMPRIAELNAVALSHGEITNASLIPIQFVEQIDSQRNYEQQIFEKGQVPTRVDSWHDYFNAHVWLNFPRLKATINALQYQSLARRAYRGQRTRIENALTLFDENGAIVLCDRPDLLAQLKAHQWHELFYEQKDAVLAHLRVVVVGHSIHEKALNPYIGMTAHALLIDQPSPFNASLAQIDDLCAQLIRSKIETFSSKSLQPLPVLGYPGWYDGPQTPAFYANTGYFRPKNPMT